MTGLGGLALGAVAATIAVVALAAFGALRWARSLRMLASGLEAGRMPSSAARYDAAEIKDLPAPVQRYFRAVLEDGQPIVTAASIRMRGTFNLSAAGEQWRRFASCERVTTRRPGFLWDARIAMLPGLTVRVVDSYIAGQGLLRASVQGLFALADIHGSGEIARGEFMRYLAEAPWYPTALLPSQGVRWDAVDDRSANATLTDGPIASTLIFRFDDAGLIESFRAEARGAMVGDTLVQLPWEGRFWNYRTRDGMLVPFDGEVAWMRPEGRKPYFRGAVARLDYEFAS